MYIDHTADHTETQPDNQSSPVRIIGDTRTNPSLRRHPSSISEAPVRPDGQLVSAKPCEEEPAAVMLCEEEEIRAWCRRVTASNGFADFP